MSATQGVATGPDRGGSPGRGVGAGGCGDSVSRETTEYWEPTAGDCESVFGPALDAVRRFAGLLEAEGELRGVLGPRELPRLWSRHLLNSAAAAEWLPESGTVIDLGSGAGLPGLVLAAMRPDLAFELVDPMERREMWLTEAVGAMGLANTTVTRSRAEDLAGERAAEAVTARAVARLGKLAGWTAALLAPGGGLVALKGRRAAAELADSRKALRRAGLVDAAVHEVVVLPGLEPTYAVTARKQASGSG